MFRFGFVAVLGKPNAGKSTLINRLVGEKVAIVSDKPQTTRDNILGVLTSKDFQLAFVDTPGIHKSGTFLDKYMMKNVRTAKASADVVLYLIDSSKPFDKQEFEHIDKMKADGIDVIVAKSKCDKTAKNECVCDVEFSSVTGEGLDELIIKILEKLSPSKTKNFLFDDEEYTDKPLKYFVAEFIRESALFYLDKEIPHGVAVEIIEFRDKISEIFIQADIVCSKDSHKGIIIGKGGEMLKKIGTRARLSCEQFLGKKVTLKLFVKVEKDWHNKPNKLSNLGYN